MKRSEMENHIKEQLMHDIANRKFSNETDDAYWHRKSKDLLAMLLGFGMLPPPWEFIAVYDEETSEEGIYCCWEPEDET